MVDVVFVLDTSGSIPEEDFQRILNFVRELASRLDVESQNARIGVVTFSDDPYPIFYLNTYDKTEVGGDLSENFLIIMQWLRQLITDGIFFPGYYLGHPGHCVPTWQHKYG